VSDHVFEVAVRRFGGSFSGEHGIGRANQHIYDRYTPALQQQFAHGLTALFSAARTGAVRLARAPSHS
jgi:FAD/FMN-containing dehydrogenase